MGWTNFPNGVTSFGIPVMGSGGFDIPTTTGSYFYVGNSSGVDAPDYGSTIDKPFATIDYAIGKCTANKSDVIVVLPGHAETSAGNGTTFDVPGVRCVGLGTGTLRPTITASAANSVVVSANNVEIRNMMVTASANAITPIFRVTGGHCTLDKIDYYEASTSYLTNSFLLTAAGGNNLTIKNCWHSCVTASAQSGVGWFILTGANDARITDNYVMIKGANAANTSVIQGTSTLSRNILISRNIFGSLGGDAVTGIISMGNNSSGIAAWNCLTSYNTTDTTAFTNGDLLIKFENYVQVYAGANSGVLMPAV